MGQGPGTGRALGICYGFESPGYMKGPGMRMGRGYGFRGGAGRSRGRGFSRGQGWGFSSDCYPYPNMSGFPRTPTLSREDEVRMLKSEAEALKRSQKEIERRLGELEKGD